jgi:flagellar biogenesis protein FliO
MCWDHGKPQTVRRGLVGITGFWLVACVPTGAFATSEPTAATSASSPSTGPGAVRAKDLEVPDARTSDLVRVPPPSSRLARPSAGTMGMNRDAGSQGWWLGSTAITLVLAVCGAICVAARKYRSQETARHVQVVDRVNLTPRHSIFVVRAGARALLIGTGTQGAPSLLGELTNADLTSLDTEPSRSAARGDRRKNSWDEGAGPLVDIHLEEQG